MFNGKASGSGHLCSPRGGGGETVQPSAGRNHGRSGRAKRRLFLGPDRQGYGQRFVFGAADQRPGASVPGSSRRGMVDRGQAYRLERGGTLRSSPSIVTTRARNENVTETGNSRVKY